MEEKFYQKIDNKFKEILDHPVPELLLKENKKIHSLMITMKGEKDMNADLPKGQLGETYTKNILKIKGYKVLNVLGSTLFDCVTEKGGERVLFEIKTDFFCGERPDNENVAFELRTWPDKKTGSRMGSILKTNANFIGYNIPKKNIMGFISTKKLLKILNDEVVKILKFKISNTNDLNDEQKLALSKQKIDDLDNLSTYVLVERFIDFLPSWYNKNSKGYKIAPNSGDFSSGGVNLLMPFEEFKKHFQILNV